MSNEKVKTYRDLLVWKKGIELVKRVYLLTTRFPDKEKFGLTSQINRSAVSIPSNIAEGWGRNNSRSFAQYLKIANGSLCELETQLLLAHEVGLINNVELEELEGITTENGKMLRSLIVSVEHKLNS